MLYCYFLVYVMWYMLLIDIISFLIVIKDEMEDFVRIVLFLLINFGKLDNGKYVFCIVCNIWD